MPQTPHSAKSAPWVIDEVPVIDSKEPFSEVVTKLISYVVKAVDAAYTYEQLRASIAGQSLRPLASSLSDNCHNPAVAAALLAARYSFGISDTHDTGLNESSAHAW